ncbi:MAG: biotin--[acetyl-CoA-carboxylase] ligase [Chitinophagaceae bacterium]|nr:biotin--[acetyl-CoA-carboxylase] ligase [Anaerolineae bacterium]
MLLTTPQLRQLIPSRAFQFFHRIDSTQNYALQWLRDGAPSGAVVIADEQVMGRGRHGRTWHTPPGVALALSIILRPTIDALPHVTMLGALAIAETLDGLGATDVGIKWPNDVHLNSKKVSGVLPEAVWEGDQLRGVVLGIGINVRVDFTDTELERSAISIEPALGIRIDRADLLVALLARIDAWAMKLGTIELYNGWKSRLNVLGQPMTMMDVNGLVKGTAEDIDPQGALLVRAADGTVHRVIAGDVALGE